MKLMILGTSRHKGEFEGRPFNFSRIYTVAPMEQGENKKGAAGVDMKAIPEVFDQLKDVDFGRGQFCEVLTELRALGGSNARETVVSATPSK